MLSMLSKLAEVKIVVEVTEDAAGVAAEELPTIQTLKRTANLKKVIKLKTQLHQDGQHQDMQMDHHLVPVLTIIPMADLLFIVQIP